MPARQRLAPSLTMTGDAHRLRWRAGPGPRYHRAAGFPRRSCEVSSLAITVLTHALVTVLICGLVIWLINFLPIEARFKMIARVIVIVLGLVSIIRSLDLLALS